MNFLQKIISKSILKSLETLSQKDPKIRSQWEELGKASQELAKTISDYKKNTAVNHQRVDSMGLSI
jgi:hypothetical protein